MSQVVESARDELAQRERAERALAHATAAGAAIQRASLDGILMVDAGARITSFNRQFAEMWKLPAGLQAGDPEAPILSALAAQVADPGGFAARVRALYANLAETSRDELTLLDGRTLDRYSAPVRLDDGTYIGRVWFFRDITAHKLADDMVREDDSRFRALVEQQIAGIFIIRGDGNLAYINGRFSALFGYTPAEVIGLPFLDLIVEKDRSTLRQAFAEHLLGGPLATQSVTAIKRKGGGVMNVLAHASLAAYQGKPALVGIVVDITEGIRSMDLLHASEERFRLLVEQAPDGIVLYDADADRFVSANASAAALFGCSREELIAAGPLRFLIDEATGQTPHDSIAEHNRQALAGVECAFERHFRSAQGREGICEIRLVRLPTLSGRLLRASLVDITARRQAESALAYRDLVRHAVNLTLAGLVAAPSLAAGMPLAL
jgi:PAS domain S-box-containing protein